MTPASDRLDAEARRLLGSAFDVLGPEQRRVVDQIVRRGLIARQETVGLPGWSARLADAAGRIGGSWIFVAGVSAFVSGWVLLNAALLPPSGALPFDLRPYVLLNLILSVLAALQASVIMMLLNRQAEKTRDRADHDYEINLKVELEIMGLHEKIEAMRDRELADILAHQVELLQELRDRPRSSAA
ncbi:MAG TPA: DUF1003 domain-containing protein [Caulobacteraceae bacterium]|jgi:uncharacterized membrane protein|nr:DUF1003 domain-containing protein [Caulobacteraceae bacterium]